MKNLIKLTVLVAVVAIFAFSGNETITKVRTTTVTVAKKVFTKENAEKAKKVYDKGVAALPEGNVKETIK